MLDYLVNLVSRLGHWGYGVIFLGAMLESAAFLGLIIPGESLVLVAGFLAAQHVLDLDALIWVVALGATLGDSIGYELGRRLGRPWLAHHGRRIGVQAARLARADEFFERHGGKAVFLGRFVGFARALVPFLAGSSHMPYRRFLPYNALGAAIWAMSVVLLGYCLGASWHIAKHWLGRASLILGCIVLLLVAFVRLWRWGMNHQAGLQRDQFLQRPHIARLRLRSAPLTSFLKARLSPEGNWGLHVTLGALVLVAASWLFGGIAEDVLTGDPLTSIDRKVATWFHGHTTPALTRFMLLVTHVHGTLGVCVFAFALAVYFIWRREWYWFLTVIVTVPGGMLLNVLMKDVFDRSRPRFTDPLLTLSSYSFPSGHVAGSTLLYGVLTAWLLPRIAALRWRVLVILFMVLMVALVALTRVYLGVHYLSDVLAAFAEAMAWLALCLTAMHTLRRHRAHRHQ